MTALSPDAFLASLQTVASTLVSLLLVSSASFVLARRNVLGDEAVRSLTTLVVVLVLPARILVALLEGMSPERLRDCALLIVAMVLMNVVGVGMGWVVTQFWRGPANEDRPIWAMSGLQNGVYIPFPLTMAIVPDAMKAQAALYIAGAFMAMSTMQWTLGAWLLRERPEGEAAASWRQRASQLLNPPILVIFVGLALSQIPGLREVATGEAHNAPLNLVLNAVRKLGSALEPLAMVILGLMIGQCRVRHRISLRAVVVPIVLRQMVAPAIFVALLLTPVLGWASPLLALVLVIEAAGPPATNLTIVARRVGGDWELISAVLLFCYLAAVVTMPFWTALVLAIRPL